MLASSVANMYEEPRPPRRGSHRPGFPRAPEGHSPLSCSGVPGSPCAPHFYYESQQPRDWMGSSPPPPPLRSHGHQSTIHPMDPREFPTTAYPQVAQHWGAEQRPSSYRATTSSIRQGQLPRLKPTSLLPRAPPRHWGKPLGDRSLPETLPTTKLATRKTLDPKIMSSLELIRQLNGGSEEFCLEKSIQESYERSAGLSASCQSVQKRCMFPACTRISVSRGLCRGHGGGRRCHIPGCTKSAQSRSNCCWAHGGGQRCEADQCMRSRKSKRFCVAHLHLEDLPTNTTQGHAKPMPTIAREPRRQRSGSEDARLAMPSPFLPSLGQALSSASRSAPYLPARRPQSLGL